MIEVKKMNNQANLKLSPNHRLSKEQQKLIQKILFFTAKHLQSKNYPAIFTIYGDAGTGKSLILSALFDQIQKERLITDSPFLKLIIIS